MHETAERTGPRVHGGLVMFAAICGLLTFVGVLLFGPTDRSTIERQRDLQLTDRDMRELIARGEFGGAVSIAAPIVEEGSPTLGVAMFYAWSLEQLGRYEEARPVWERLRRVASHRLDHPDMWTLLMAGWGERRAGDPERARELFLAAADRAVPVGTPDVYNPLSHYNAACAYSLAEEHDLAIEHLTIALEGGGTRPIGLAWIRADPDFVDSGLAEDPRFRSLLSRAKAGEFDRPIEDMGPPADLVPDPEPEPETGPQPEAGPADQPEPGPDTSPDVGSPTPPTPDPGASDERDVP